MFGASLIFVIVITGGVIAFFGDRIGTRVGKRRLTLWGLRPRYTSIIITILTGILIAGSTMGVLTILSYDVRTALFGMEALKKQTQQLSGEVKLRNAELATAKTEIEAAKTELARRTAELLATNQRIAVIAKELTGLQAEKQALDSRINVLSAARAELQKDVDRLNELTANLRKGIATVREGTIVLRAGEVLAVSVIQGGGSPADIERRLTEYLQAANAKLRERFQIEDPKLDLIFIPRVHAEEVIAFLAAKPEAIVLRLLSAGNVVVGEPVIGQFEAFPNRQVYAKNAVVLSDTVSFDGAANEAEQVLAIFLQRVNATAVQQGVIPDPIQGTVGAVSLEQYFEAVNQLRRYKGKVELIAITSETIFSAGPLRIVLQVKPQPSLIPATL